ncbi:hypothetical protein PA25_23610 [Pseudoalteromonas sp. A25]|uniref:cytochrome-c peroxidase n=1 Tax=Pseudoalteromonas sp. A25 TaxID=116092 RepID=UPI0012611350|nr:cytochrome c peroxidase [Pseudoalteromonas sp. A25]BBN82376.1 hypothetical protein PA25_23610 [Pseudoalteromonas sp. A25]
MTTKYIVLILSVLCAIFVSFWLQLSRAVPSDLLEGSETASVDAKFIERQVDAALQPLPLIEQYNEQWVQLGKALFKSPLLSVDNTVSCASCHDLYNGGDDGFPVSLGVNQQLGERNSPTVINSAFNFRQFWDGRSATLAEQVHGPIHNPVEMATNWPQVIAKLTAQPGFLKSFNALSADGINAENIVKALVLFEESLVSEDTPIDRYLLGDISALSEQQQRGLQKFMNFGCITCHQGKNIGGNLYQKIGRLDSVPQSLLTDLGRFNQTNNEEDKHVFKVPSLRNVTLTAPYFHNGSVDELSEAIRIMAKGQLGLNLSDEDILDLEALFHAFEGQLPRSLVQ